MAKVPNVKNLTTLTKGFRTNLERRAGITNWSYDSTVRSLTDSLVSEIYITQNSLRRTVADLQVGSAIGKALERLGTTYGVSRLPPTYAQVDWTERSLMFFTDTTFGTINNGASIVIPEGTEITVSNSQDDTVIKYITTAEYTGAAGANFVYCSARAATMGATHNIASHALTTHSFTSYADVSNGTLRVTNRYPIVNGRNLETDDSLRFRISNMFGTLATTNVANISLRSMTVPGVLRAKPIPGYYGIGTCAVIVFGAGGISNTDLAKRTQERLNVIQVPGMELIAIPGIDVSFDIEVEVQAKGLVTAASRTALKRDVRRVISQFLSRQSPVTNLVDFAALKEMILANAPSVVGLLDRRSGANIFKAIYVRKVISGTTSERSLLLGTTYTLEDDEYASLGSLEISFVERV